MISEFPLFLFTTLAGAAAGAYVARAIAPLPEDRKRPWLFALVSLVLLAISGIALLLHLGHPERVLGAFANPGAGITQEGVTTVLFGITVVLDLAFCLFGKQKDAPRWLVVVTAALGVVMTVTMGFAYYEFIGTPAWSNPVTVPFFVIGDLAMGAGLFLLFEVEALKTKSFGVYNLVAQVAAAVCVLAVGVHFANVGYSALPFAVGTVLAVLAAVFGVLGRKGKASCAYLVFACASVGMIVARYAFYTGCII